MKDIGISQFKNHAVEILTRLSKTHEDLIITKRGIPLARVTPLKHDVTLPIPGKLSDKLIFEDDIVSPLGAEMWTACQ